MWHKAPCSSRDYSGVWESGPRKRDDDGDVHEDDHLSDDSSPNGTPAPSRERERRRGSPPCASSSMASPLDGERFSLWSLAVMAMMAVGERSNLKKILRTRKIMVMHSNEREEYRPHTLVDRKRKR